MTARGLLHKPFAGQELEQPSDVTLPDDGSGNSALTCDHSGRAFLSDHGVRLGGVLLQLGAELLEDLDRALEHQ